MTEAPSAFKKAVDIFESTVSSGGADRRCDGVGAILEARADLIRQHEAEVEAAVAEERHKKNEAVNKFYKMLDERDARIRVLEEPLWMATAARSTPAR